MFANTIQCSAKGLTLGHLCLKELPQAQKNNKDRQMPNENRNSIFITSPSNPSLLLSHSLKSCMLKSLIQTTVFKLSCVVCKSQTYIFQRTKDQVFSPPSNVTFGFQFPKENPIVNNKIRRIKYLSRLGYFSEIFGNLCFKICHNRFPPSWAGLYFDSFDHSENKRSWRPRGRSQLQSLPYQV